MGSAIRELEVVTRTGHSKHEAIEPIVVFEAADNSQTQATTVHRPSSRQIADRPGNPKVMQLRPQRQMQDRKRIPCRIQGRSTDPAKSEVSIKPNRLVVLFIYIDAACVQHLDSEFRQQPPCSATSIAGMHKEHFNLEPRDAEKGNGFPISRPQTVDRLEIRKLVLDQRNEQLDIRFGQK
jgi:hypothetical protein